jgi:ABC-type multidrug transport system fused ATPase/permease subunit
MAAAGSSSGTASASSASPTSAGRPRAHHAARGGRGGEICRGQRSLADERRVRALGFRYRRAASRLAGTQRGHVNEARSGREAARHLPRLPEAFEKEAWGDPTFRVKDPMPAAETADPLGQQYRGDLRPRHPRLKGVSLSVPRGGIVAILGANGAGKTTTLKAISNLLRAERGEVTKGSIEFEGERIEKPCRPTNWCGAAASR